MTDNLVLLLKREVELVTSRGSDTTPSTTALPLDTTKYREATFEAVAIVFESADPQIPIEIPLEEPFWS